MTILIVVAHKDFDEIEFASTKNMMLSQGAEIEVASTKKGEVFSDHKHPIQADLSLNEVDVSKYEGIVFVGGIGAEDDYFNNSTAHNLIREANEQGIILGASSISPAIFANAGVLKGKKATVYDDEEGADRKIFSQNGVEYTGDPVTVDGNIVTCNHRKNIKQFASTFAKQLSE
jgi:protease I